MCTASVPQMQFCLETVFLNAAVEAVPEMMVCHPVCEAQSSFVDVRRDISCGSGLSSNPIIMDFSRL